MLRVWPLMLVLILSTMPLFPASAAGGESDRPAGLIEGDYVCPPHLQLRFPDLCPLAGPAGQLEELARQGMYPERPLPLRRYSAYLSYLPYDYVRVVDNAAKLYPNATAAINGTDPERKIGPGLVYYTYLEKVEKGKGDAYRTRHGYVSAADALEVDPSTFRGLAFRRSPDRQFGWVIEGGACSLTGPDSGEHTGNCYVKYTVVQIYAVERVGERDWYQIGPEEWMEQRTLAVVTPDGTRPEGVPEDVSRWIVVDLYEQTVTAYENGELVYATVASTGRDGWWTKPGSFQVWVKLERDLMTGGLPDDPSFYHLDDVPWVLYFDEARALHGAYWHDRFGTTTSRGCVNLTPTDARWFFEFSEEGTWVHVWDPSGETPTDPSLYTAGGA